MDNRDWLVSGPWRSSRWRCLGLGLGGFGKREENEGVLAWEGAASCARYSVDTCVRDDVAKNVFTGRGA